MKPEYEHWIHISDWMIAKLHLKGNELLVYAIIHGFSQDGKSNFYGSLKYLMDWTNLSKQGLINVLKSLIDKKLIGKSVKRGSGNIFYCEYWSIISRENEPQAADSAQPKQEKSEEIASVKNGDSQSKNFTAIQNTSKESLPVPVKKVDLGGQKSLPATGQESLPNTTNNISKDTSTSIPQEKEKTEEADTLDKNIKKTVCGLFNLSAFPFSTDFVPKLKESLRSVKIADLEEIKDYLKWHYNAVVEKKPNSVLNFYYATAAQIPYMAQFISERMKSNIENTAAQNQCLLPKVKCPVCGCLHAELDDCPVCGLWNTSLNNPKKIKQQKKIFNLPKDVQKQLQNEINAMTSKMRQNGHENDFSKVFNDSYTKQVDEIVEKYTSVDYQGAVNG